MNFISVNLPDGYNDKFKSNETMCFHDFFLIFITGTRFCLCALSQFPDAKVKIHWPLELAAF